MTIPSQKAAYVLMHVGIPPWKASEREIALAERYIKEFHYIEGAADELKRVLDANPSR